jgi:hypothetical protein
MLREVPSSASTLGGAATSDGGVAGGLLLQPGADRSAASARAAIDDRCMPFLTADRHDSRSSSDRGLVLFAGTVIIFGMNTSECEEHRLLDGDCEMTHAAIREAESDARGVHGRERVPV